MKTLLAIPTYWGSENYGLTGLQSPIYDHPTSINAEGTLDKAIESLKIFKKKDFDLLVLASGVSKKIEREMNKKLVEKLKQHSQKNKIYLFSNIELDSFKKIIHKYHSNKYDVFLDFKGYSQVRNLSLIIAQLLDADIIVSIDDDEYVTDPKFLLKAKEFIGGDLNGKRIDGIAGYYVYENKRTNLLDNKSKWTSVWDQTKQMNKAFNMSIEKGPRLKEAHFMLGGCSVIHKDLFTKVPYDTKIPRGEDMDYLINAKMFGFNIFFDRKFYVRHDPPPNKYPLWKTHRMDVRRFIYERQKIQQQEPRENMRMVRIKDVSPYLSAFIGKGLNSKIERSCGIIAEQYRVLGDNFSATRYMENAALAKSEHLPKYNVFDHLLLLQSKWVSFSKVLAQKKMKKALKKCLIVFD